jgi:hypothetical protein
MTAPSNPNGGRQMPSPAVRATMLGALLVVVLVGICTAVTPIIFWKGGYLGG